MQTYASIDVAKAFIGLASSATGPERVLSNMKLQKLCFFAQLVSLCAGTQIPIISDQFHAWDFGPVEPKLFNRIKRVEAKTFDAAATEIQTALAGAVEIVDPEAKLIVSKVWDKFKSWTAVQLSSLTHRIDSPWFMTYYTTKYGVITNESIVKYMWGRPI